MADDGLLTGDFYRFEQLLAGPERETLHRVRDWLAAEVVPIANRCWERAEFPFELIPRFAELGIAGIAYDEVPGRPPSEGTREINTLIVDRAVTGHSAFV